MQLPEGLFTTGCLVARNTLIAFFLIAGVFGIAGCSRLRPKPPAETVYVVAKQTFLRERVAAVANRVAQVQNGQPLEVLEHGRRFLKVKTQKNEVGWIEDHAVIDSKIYGGFEELKKQHQKDPVVATAVLRDDLYMHLKPGRDTERYFLLPENEKLQLLMRASVPKPTVPGAMAPRPVISPSPKGPPKRLATAAGNKGLLKPGSSAKAGAPAKPVSNTNPAPAAVEIMPVALEDWWLVRDSKGDAGWLLARRMDVDVPEEIGGYSEGQKMVGAYLLTRVEDDESKFPDHMAPEYVAVLNAYKDGLPYDFDQVRVFTWNAKKHRYETAFRQRGLAGYLPVTVGVQTLDNAGPVPTFSFKQASGVDPTIDPETGVAKAPQTETSTFRMDGVTVKRVGTPPASLPKTPEQLAKEKAKAERHAAFLKAHPGGVKKRKR